MERDRSVSGADFLSLLHFRFSSRVVFISLYSYAPSHVVGSAVVFVVVVVVVVYFPHSRGNISFSGLPAGRLT